jgi:hypothetical protein
MHSCISTLLTHAQLYSILCELWCVNCILVSSPSGRDERLPFNAILFPELYFTEVSVLWSLSDISAWYVIPGGHFHNGDNVWKSDINNVAMNSIVGVSWSVMKSYGPYSDCSDVWRAGIVDRQTIVWKMTVTLTAAFSCERNLIVKQCLM